MSATHRYVVAYDVTEDALRRQVRTTCRAYGGRQQYSLFEMYLNEREHASIVDELTDLLEQRDEYASIKIYSVGPQERDATLGDDRSTEAENVV